MDKTKMKMMDRLAAKGFDTEKKVMSLELENVHKNGLKDDIGGILELKDVIRRHRLYAYLYNGTDEVPAKKEEDPNADDDRRQKAESAGAYGLGGSVS